MGVQNGDLRKKINESKKENKNIEEKIILDWIIQISSGLKYLHSDAVKIVHRDIKPEYAKRNYFFFHFIHLNSIHIQCYEIFSLNSSNILLTKDNVIKIGDLGECKHLVNGEAKTFKGTRLYMSPEQYKLISSEEEDDSNNIKHYNFKTDIWCV